MFLIELSPLKKPGCPPSPGNEEGSGSVERSLRGHSLNRLGWASGATRGSGAAYLLQLKLRGEPSGHRLDEVGEGEGTSAEAVGERRAMKGRELMLRDRRATLQSSQPRRDCPYLVDQRK